MRTAILTVLLFSVFITVTAQTNFKRSRGEGLYRCESANTVGSGNIWAGVRVIGFLWDENPDTKQPIPCPFLEVNVDGGVLDIVSIFLESRLISYFWDKKPQFGNLAGGIKLTVPNNKDIRLHGFGVNFRYIHSFLDSLKSIAGYRNGGTGFSPEGFIFEGGSLQIEGLYDFDLVSKLSILPLKLLVNLGVQFPFNRDFSEFSQYLVELGIAYCSINFDIFIEYSFKGFFNGSFKPKIFVSSDLGMQEYRKWEVAFTENPMYITPGGRVRYEKGTVLYLCVPLLISSNKGSSITQSDKDKLSHREDFLDEIERGITDPFDPWYAKWKIVAQLSFPIRYKQTSAEMRRNYLLLKNVKGKKKFNLDERINIKPEADEKDRAVEQRDRKKRL